MLSFGMVFQEKSERILAGRPGGSVGNLETF